MRFFLVFTLCLFCFKWVVSQETIEVEQGSVPEVARFLAEPGELFREDVALVESVLDLVEAYTFDSIVEKKRQHLSGFIGRVARLGARYWERLDDHKRKYVGTMSRSYKIYDGYADEVDMNIFLIPHLKPYVNMVQKGFDKAFERGRKEKHYRYDNPEFPCPEELKWKDLGYLTVECEGTPPGAYRTDLDSLFIPTGEGKHPLGAHPNFGVKHPSVGMYGTWCMDCNHNCRPEIHPFEWLWWLDFAPEEGESPTQKSWMVGLLRDGSGRFEDWSPGPLNGVLAVPVVVPEQAQKITIAVESLVAGPFQKGLRTLQPQKTSSSTDQHMERIELSFSQGRTLSLEIDLDKSMPNLHCKTMNWRHDPEKGLLMGYFQIDVSVMDLYTCRIVVDYEGYNE